MYKIYMCIYVYIYIFVGCVFVYIYILCHYSVIYWMRVLFRVRPTSRGDPPSACSEVSPVSRDDETPKNSAPALSIENQVGRWEKMGSSKQENIGD